MGRTGLGRVSAGVGGPDILFWAEIPTKNGSKRGHVMSPVLGSPKTAFPKFSGLCRGLASSQGKGHPDRVVNVPAPYRSPLGPNCQKESGNVSEKS